MLKVYNRQDVQDEYVATGANAWVKLDDLPHGFFPRADDIPALRGHAPEVFARAVMERAVVRTLCDELLEQGFELRLHDGEEWVTEWTKDREVIMFDLMATDIDHLHVKRGTVGVDLLRGSITFVYGNAGYEVLSDHSAWLGEFMTKTNKFMDEMESGYHGQ